MGPCFSPGGKDAEELDTAEAAHFPCLLLRDFGEGPIDADETGDSSKVPQVFRHDDAAIFGDDGGDLEVRLADAELQRVKVQIAVVGGHRQRQD